MSEDKNQNSESLSALPDEPEPDPPDTPTWRAIKKGAKWGSIAGFVVAQLAMSSSSIQTPFGPIYGGNVFLLFAICAGIGTAAGAGFGWASTLIDDSDDLGPPPT